MTNLCTDEMVFFRNLTKIDTDENKAIYSIQNVSNLWRETSSVVDNIKTVGTKII